MTHQQMATPPPPSSTNPYQEGSLIFVMTTPPERANKLTPRWKGPFRVKRIPNPYQVVYEDGSAWHTIHINHAKPAKLAAPDLPIPTPEPEPSLLPLGYLPKGYLGPRPRQPPPPPQATAPAEGSSLPPTASVPAPSSASPPASETPPLAAAPANRNLAPAPLPTSHPASEMPPPATVPANQNSEPAFRPRRSLRLNPELDRVCAIKGPPGNLALQSQAKPNMARTYPLSVSYNQCLGAKEEPLSFASVGLEDLRNGELEYLSL